MTRAFSLRLTEAVLTKRCHLIVGLDPRPALLPRDIAAKWRDELGNTLEAAAKATLEFNKGIIDALADIIPAVKPQLACYEQLGVPGMETLAATIEYANAQGLLVIADGKRNDIGSTAESYADAYLGETVLGKRSLRAFAADALTVNPYLGRDSLAPMIERCVSFGHGIFVLVKTSNPGSKELQDLDCGGRKVYEIVGEMCHELGLPHLDERSYSPIGAVVGATYPDEAARLRSLMPHNYFLVPGFGAQGGKPSDVVPCFNPDGLGAVVNSAREVIFAYQKHGGDYPDAARKVAIVSRDAINQALAEVKNLAW
ncbi:MAG: Orotidine 5'-phosphate decarboxylase [Firmicutes bacterium]|nr:Orotidine 5'-phosphate decarboxylase [candidate division NPL-UPA2 bacterium]